MSKPDPFRSNPFDFGTLEELRLAVEHAIWCAEQEGYDPAMVRAETDADSGRYRLRTCHRPLEGGLDKLVIVITECP